MKARPYFPLLAKVLGWLLLHLVVLALAFVGFVSWQLGLGLDSLLSGSAGERLRAFGDSARLEILEIPRSGWDAAIQSLAKDKHVTAMVVDPIRPEKASLEIPGNVLARAKTAIPPPPSGARPMRPGDFEGGRKPPPFDDVENRLPWERRSPEDAGRSGAKSDLRTDESRPSSRPVFLLRGENGDGYWAGVHLTLPGPAGRPRRHELLLIRADRLDGSGMFFDFKPWLWGGLAVLLLSLAFWTPFVWSITRYIRRLTISADRIAAGEFQISLPPRGNDELGSLGHAIQAMAGRLDHLVSGQKRFLGDAAHELCAPLARLRTGLGILEMKLGESERGHLSSIESDAQDLATLVEEILTFSRAGRRTPRMQPVFLEPLIKVVAAREGGESAPELMISPGLTATTDPSLLVRALGNLVRNARVHAGPNAKIVIEGGETAEHIHISVADDGPGVPHDEVSRLFEPFYRPDRSRSRETGGSGLGLSIVHAAVETCGGELVVTLPPGGGFVVTIRLRKKLLD